jgi:hypothetical protein
MQMFSEDPIEIFQRVGWSENKTTWSIALGFVTLVFALTLLLWPVAALLRRHYQRPLALSGTQPRLRWLVKLSCAINLAALIAFATILVYGFSNLSLFGERLDPWLRCLQVLFLIGLINAIAMVYASFRLWQGGSRGIWMTLYRASLVLAACLFIWIVLSSRILQISLQY